MPSTNNGVQPTEPTPTPHVEPDATLIKLEYGPEQDAVVAAERQSQSLSQSIPSATTAEAIPPINQTHEPEPADMMDISPPRCPSTAAATPTYGWVANVAPPDETDNSYNVQKTAEASRKPPREAYAIGSQPSHASSQIASSALHNRNTEQASRDDQNQTPSLGLTTYMSSNNQTEDPRRSVGISPRGGHRCDPCHRAHSKCDGVKPICGTCASSTRLRPCTWPQSQHPRRQSEDPNTARRSASPPGTRLSFTTEAQRPSRSSSNPFHSEIQQRIRSPLAGSPPPGLGSNPLAAAPMMETRQPALGLQGNAQMRARPYRSAEFVPLPGTTENTCVVCNQNPGRPRMLHGGMMVCDSCLDPEKIHPHWESMDRPTPLIDHPSTNTTTCRSESHLSLNDRLAGFAFHSQITDITTSRPSALAEMSLNVDVIASAPAPVIGSAFNNEARLSYMRRNNRPILPPAGWEHNFSPANANTRIPAQLSTAWMRDSRPQTSTSLTRVLDPDVDPVQISQAAYASVLQRQRQQQNRTDRQSGDGVVGLDRPSTIPTAAGSNDQDQRGMLGANLTSSRGSPISHVLHPDSDGAGPVTDTSSQRMMRPTLVAPRRGGSNAPSLLRSVLAGQIGRQNSRQTSQSSAIPPHVDESQPLVRRRPDEAHPWARPSRELYGRFIMPSPPWHDNAERTRFRALQNEYWAAQLFLAGYISDLRSSDLSPQPAVLAWVRQMGLLRSSWTRAIPWSTFEDFRIYVYTMRNWIRDSAMTGVTGPGWTVPAQYLGELETVDQFRAHMTRMEGRPPW